MSNILMMAFWKMFFSIRHVILVPFNGTRAMLPPSNHGLRTRKHGVFNVAGQDAERGLVRNTSLQDSVGHRSMTGSLKLQSDPRSGS